MPTTWYRLHNLPLQHFALKTGTTDKKVWKMIYPRDGWSILYNAHDLIVSRAGNANGNAMDTKAFGWEINHFVIRQYLSDLVTSWSMRDEERIVSTVYHTGGRYQNAQYDTVSPDIAAWLRRFQWEIPKMDSWVVMQWEFSKDIPSSGTLQKSWVIHIVP
jgi:hypothetical protein